MAQPHTHFEILTVKESEEKFGTTVKVEGSFIDVVASICRSMERDKRIEAMILLASEAYCQHQMNNSNEKRD